MDQYRICNRCVMDTTVPDIEFNSAGVCNYCRAAENRLSSELYVGKEYKELFDNLIKQIKKVRINKTYDCIIGVSGGVDSSFVAYLVKHKYGLRPLAVHFDNGWNSELAVQNIEILLKKLDIDLYTHVVDWEEFKDLQLSFLRASVANCEIPTDHAIIALLYQTAAKYKIRYILHGGNLSTESIMPSIWMHDARDLLFMKTIHKKFGTKPLRTVPVMSYSRLGWYILVRKIRYIGVLNYLYYEKEKAMQFLEDEFGWRKYGGKHFESIYTRFFQGYFLPKKFGMDKRRPHFASLIISGQMSREKALTELENPPYDPQTAKEDVDYIRQKFCLSDDDFNVVMRNPIKTSDDYSNSQWLFKRFSPVASAIHRIATGRKK